MGFVEWTFDQPEDETTVLRDEDGSLKAASVPKVIAKLTADAGGVFTVLSLPIQILHSQSSFC